MARIDLSDFSGGMRSGNHPRAFRDGEWRQIKGLSWDDRNGRLRAQGELQCLDETFISLFGRGPDSNLLLYNRTDSQWEVVAVGPAGFGARTAVTTGSPGVPTTLNFARFHTTGTSDSAGENIVIVSDPTSGSAYTLDPTNTWTAISNRYPNDSTANGFPHFGPYAIWRDYLVVNATRYIDDPTLAFSSTNYRLVGNVLWFSQPGKPLRWEPIDAEFMPAVSDGEGISGLVPCPWGLVVAGDEGSVWVLRGTPNNHTLETVGEFVPGGAAGGATVFCAPLDAVLLGSRAAPVIVGVGESSQFILDIPVDGGNVEEVTVWRDRIFVSVQAARFGTSATSARLFEGTVVDDGIRWAEIDLQVASGASTATAVSIASMTPLPFGVAMAVTVGPSDVRLCLYLPESENRAEVYSTADLNTVHAETTATLQTPVLGGRDKILWRSATIEATAAPASVTTQLGSPDDPVATDTPTPAEVNQGEYEVKLPGPNRQASVTWTFQGDVTVEDVWIDTHDGGKQDR